MDKLMVREFITRIWRIYNGPNEYLFEVTAEGKTLARFVMLSDAVEYIRRSK